MAVADAIAERSWCVRRKAGCVIVTADNQLVATGYNGPPAGLEISGPCDQWCDRARTGGGLSYDDCLAAHSEINAFMRADQSMRGGTLYVTSCPCYACAKAIANSGVVRVVQRITSADTDREPERTLGLFEDAGIAVRLYS
jgi:dCMP deaminase